MAGNAIVLAPMPLATAKELLHGPDNDKTGLYALTYLHVGRSQEVQNLCNVALAGWQHWHSVP